MGRIFEFAIGDIRNRLFNPDEHVEIIELTKEMWQLFNELGCLAQFVNGGK
jgi:hypothetical protein